MAGLQRGILTADQEVQEAVEKEGLLHDNLEEVLKAGRRARDLVKQILAFSRQSSQERQTIQINNIIKEALKLLRASLPSTIEIQQDIRSDSLVLADPTQIHQILMNLCANAAHAMREKGDLLEVSLTDVVLDSDDLASQLDINPGKYLKLTVSDTGSGMTQDVLERIFDPFFTTKRREEGTGMGLSVVHGIVKSHGGAITVYSEPGEGSTFDVFLPAAEQVTKLETEPDIALPTGNERILFVDDEPSIVDLFKKWLRALGYEVVTRTSSVKALELFKDEPDRFDLVITDMTMPNLRGDRFAKEILKIRSDMPIILYTGFSEEISEEKAKGMGIKAFAMKPISHLDIAKTIRQVLDY